MDIADFHSSDILYWHRFGMVVLFFFVLEEFTWWGHRLLLFIFSLCFFGRFRVRCRAEGPHLTQPIPIFRLFFLVGFFVLVVLEGLGVGALHRCHLSNWRFNPETVHFLSSKRPFLPTMFVSKCYKTKHFGQDSLFHKKPKLGRKNHYFHSAKMGERAKSL